ncbi:ABC transporter substrate-binding protein [Lederbergia ruris]|uniref:ABC transporter substrate-binding protein n=1 Tax=Lederbergia ruris TaxID=217495 RepID=UPI00399F6A97
MKRISLLLIVTLMLGFLAACGSNNNDKGNDGNTNTDKKQTEAKAPEDYEGELNIWTFFGDVEKMATKFEEKYPNVKVNVSVFPGDQYQTKLMNAINTKTDVPDIFDLERGYMGKFINQPFVADLSAMGADELLKDYVPYVKELGTAEDGTIRAISDHSSPGGFWYHRDLAKEYLGTDDPDEISAMVDSWDKIIDLGKKIKKDSNGKVHLISHFGDAFNTAVSHQEMWVQDGKLTIDPAWEEVFNNMKALRDEGVDAKLGYMSAGWGNALNDGGVILFAMPAWAGFMVDNDGGAAEGKYGLAKTPQGYFEGGTYRAIYEGSEKKDLAYEFVKYIASEEWQQYNLEETGNMPGLQTVYDNNMDSYKSPFFGDQPVLEVYKDLVMDIPAKKATGNEDEISRKFYDAASEAVDNGESYEKALKIFKDSIKNGYPDIEVK